MRYSDINLDMIVKRIVYCKFVFKLIIVVI